MRTPLPVRNTSVGRKLYISILSVFLLFAGAFIVFQQLREKQFKIDMLDLRLQNYNTYMHEWLTRTTDRSEKNIDDYVVGHHIPGLRVTIIRSDGKVVYDNRTKDYANVINHLTRPEVAQAIKKGHGSTVDRNSATVQGDFFYSATYFKEDSTVIRSALPYDDNLVVSLRADMHYIWFAITAIVVLMLILYRFTRRLSNNIDNLKIFAGRADKNESLDTEDLIRFPDDELGEIAERIIKIYKRLQTTRKEQDMLKRQLTQNIAHELKTPVAGIYGYLETIIRNPEMDETTRSQFLSRCHALSQRLSSLLRDISTLNRIDDAPQMIKFEPTDISAIVEGIVREVALKLRDKNMTFVNRLPEHIRVMANAGLIYSIFANLTDNAIAYAGERTTVTLEAEERDESWAFVFADNGVGISTEHLPRLFERFYRVDKGRSREMGGTGLGLAIVKNAVLMHGGHIRAYNGADGGLTLEFSIMKNPADGRS